MRLLSRHITCSGWRGLALAMMYGWTGLAGEPTAATNRSGRFEIRTWQTDEGLPQNTVNAIAQTHDGYLWVGTREGLARFDGVRFTVVDDVAAPYLKQSLISALCVSRDGSLWIASESNGVTRLQDGIFTHFLKADGLPDNQIQCLLESRDGGLWIGGETGLARYKEGRFTLFPDVEMLHNNSVKALCEDAQGILRIATVTGLVSVDSEGTVSTNNFSIGPVQGVLKAAAVDRRGRLWLGSTYGLLSLTDAGPGKYTANKTVTGKITTAIHEDQAGQLWVGTFNGLMRRNGDNPNLPEWSNQHVVDDLINTIYEDREQTLWIGGRDGLYRLSPARFVTLTTQDGLPGNNVVSVLEDHTGAMWFATWSGGVTRRMGGKFTTVTMTNGLTSDKVLSLHESHDGRLWVGMDYLGGLNRLSAKLANDVPPVSGLLASPIRVIHEDDTGALWVGTGKGLNVIRGNQVTVYTPTNGLAGSDVKAICVDRQGAIWIGTDGGLSRWTGNGFTNLTTQQGLSQNHINAIYADAAGELWIGTKSGGLNRIKGGRITSYTTKQGLFNDDVLEILEDAAGHLWMSCRRGIFRVNRRELDDFDLGKVTKISCTTFGREDGLATVQCSGVAKPAGWKSRDGRLWFATIRGVVAVEPDIKINDQPPAVVIEDILVDQQVLRASGSRPTEDSILLIPPGSGRIEIHYTALSLQAAEKNRFKYRLEGVDADWTEVGHQRVAYYNNVLPGRYRFRVIACNNDGVWNETGAAVALRLEPHFWQTWWFRAMGVGGLVLMMGLIYRARVARLRALENLRVRIAADLHDDVGSRLTKVAMVTELADRETGPDDPGKIHIQNITRTVRDITRAMDEIVWTINPRNDTLENLANYIFHYAQEYFQDTGVRCRLDLPSDLPDQNISTEERHHLFMVVKEALNNILKHAAATEVRIGLALTDEHVTIVIADNGHGIAAGRPDATGEGMTNMRERLEKIGGEFKLRSTSDGTTITLRLRNKWRR